MLKMKHVEGRKNKDIKLYALSTCGWCKKTKALLNELGLGYDYIDVDMLEGKDEEEAEKEVKKWNPRCNYPTMVVDGNKCIAGFQEDEIKGLAR